MKSFSTVLVAFAFAFSILCTTITSAQTAAPNTARDNSLYLALGEKAGITQLSDDFVTRIGRNHSRHTFFPGGHHRAQVTI